MSPADGVDSFHINIQAGDCAIHLLIEYDTDNPNLRTVQKAILIDGGKGGEKYMPNITATLSEIPQLYTISGHTPTKPLQFDGVIITHWDDDHYQGIYKLLANDLWAKKKAAGTGWNPNSWQPDIFRYGTTGDRSQPLTTVYCPYWTSTVPGKNSHYVGFGETVESGQSYLSLVIPTQGRKGFSGATEIYQKVAKLRYQNILGMEFFQDKPLPSTVNPANLNNISELLQAHSQSDEFPGMYCLAADMVVIGPKQQPNMKGLEANAGHGGGVGIVEIDPPTKTNQASIACMIIWGDNGQLSHYFAGDLDDRREKVITQWTGVNGAPAVGKSVTSMKASHHGANNAFPHDMFSGFSPENIIISAGTDFGHPRFEILTYLSLFYTYQRLDPEHYMHEYRDFLVPVYTTVYPYWFAKSKTTKNFVAPAWNKVSTKAFDDAATYKIYQDAFEALYAAFKTTLESESKIVPNCILDEYRSTTWTGNPESQRVQKLQWLAQRVTADWDQISQIGSDSYPLTSAKNVFYGAQQTPVVPRRQTRWVMVESRQPYYKDGTVWIKRNDGQQMAPLRYNWARVDPDGLDAEVRMTFKAKVEVPRWKAKIFGDTPATVPLSQLTGTLPNNISVLIDGDEYLDGDPDPNETSEPLNPSTDFAVQIAEPPHISRPKFTAATAEPGFYYCSSRVPGESGPGVTVCDLKQGTDLDTFTSSLHSGVVALHAQPTTTTAQNFLDDDEWQIWWKAAIGSKTMSALGDDTQILGFGTSITFGEYTLDFDTASMAVTFPTPIIPKGLIIDSNTTILGLNPNSNNGNPMKFKLSDVYTALGISGKPKVPLKVTLDPTAMEQRNAIWFNPALNYSTTLRLAFTIDEVEQLNLLFTSFNLGISVDSGVVIGSKVASFTWDLKHKVTTSIAYSIVVSLQGLSSAAPIQGVLVLETDRTQVIVICNTQDGWSVWVNWLANLLGIGGSDFVSWLDSIVDHTLPRRFQFSLDEKNTLKACEFDFEATLKVGKGSSQQSVAALFTLLWTKATGIEIKGELWTDQPNPTDNEYLPGFETYNQLSPSTQNAATSLSLLTLIPGQPFDPNTIPQGIIPDVQAASFDISSDAIKFYGALKTKDPDPSASNVPPLRLSLLSLAATYAPKTSELTFDLELNVLLQGKTGTEPPPPPAMLYGSLQYDKQAPVPWSVGATIQDLNVGTLYTLFDSDSQESVMALLRDFTIISADLEYNFGGGAPSDFTFSGKLKLGILELDLDYKYPTSKEWDFTATLKVLPEGVKDLTVQSVVSEITNDIVLPDFVGKIPLASLNITLALHAKKQTVSDKDFVFFLTELKIGDFEILFVQYHTAGWAKPKRVFRAAVTGLPNLDDVPVVSQLVQPFDEMYFLYLTTDPGQTIQGISFAELKCLQDFVASQGSTSPILVKTSLAKPQDTDVAITPGLHFVIVLNENNKPTAVLDYAFGSTDKKSVGMALVTANADTTNGENNPPDGPASMGTLKKSFGPLTVKNVGLHYKGGVLSVLLDATFKLGPIELDLLGFSLGINLNGFNLQTFPKPSVGLNGMGVSFNQPPTSIAGMFEHMKTENMDLYAGGLEVSFTPYAFLAGGCYGTITDSKGNSFKTVAIFGKLNGPLVELEFAEISGICGGFGYNSLLTLPTVDQVNSFPFIGDNTKPGPGSNPLTLFESFMPTSDKVGWVIPTEDDLWLAAGLKVTAFQTLSVNAVVVVEFDPTVKLAIFADCVASFPPEGTQFVYVELGILAVVDFAAGSMIIEGKLAPTSFVFDPSCHLTGGFALCYWFGPSDYAGDWVFTIGGYHPAYKPKANYPTPDRLSISWSLDSISILGQSYFAITPKACMAGGYLQASLSLGPLYAYFDAWADFLINYHPFYFMGDIGVTVGVKFTLDLWICTIHINIEIGASLNIQGPTTHGTVHVNFWVFGFDINFGERHPQPDPLLLKDFYTKILQQPGTSQTSAHTIACESGMVPANTGNGVVPKPSTWNVRGGGFVCSVTSPFAFTKVTITDGDSVQDVTNNIYSRPMQTPVEKELTSTLTVTVTDTYEGTSIPGFHAKELVGNLPTSIWGAYSTDEDPMQSGNQIPSLLSGNNATVALMNGIQITAPDPKFSPEEIPAFHIKEASTDLVGQYPQGALASASQQWFPLAPVQGEQQWINVQSRWLNPLEGNTAAQDFTNAWISALGWLDDNKQRVKLDAAAPSLLLKEKETFETYYLSAPMLSVT